MWEVILGIILGLGYAIFFPNSFESLKQKILRMIKFEKCEHDKPKEDNGRPYRKFDDR